MLPFLKPKKNTTVMAATLSPTGDMGEMQEEGGHSPGLMASSEALIRAIHDKDATGVASALKDAHEHNSLSVEPDLMESED